MLYIDSLVSLCDITRRILKPFVLHPCEFFKSVFAPALECQQGQNRFLLGISNLDLVYIREREEVFVISGVMGLWSRPGF